MKTILTLFFLWISGGLAFGQEVQQHGLVFENWICDTFFEGYRPQYTEKWDIPASVNKNFGGIPINPKATKYPSSVDMGDALRQYDINESFILIVGYWEQQGDQKRIVNIIAPRIETEMWRKLWHPITRSDLERLDAVIKDRNLDYVEAREQAHAIKNSPPFSEAIIVVNPKIDSKTQRRLQCSLRFKDLFEFLAPDQDPAIQKQPELWGIPYPKTIDSAPRSFSKENPTEPDAPE